jgi:hypothetical protein
MTFADRVRHWVDSRRRRGRLCASRIERVLRSRRGSDDVRPAVCDAFRDGFHDVYRDVRSLCAAPFPFPRLVAKRVAPVRAVAMWWRCTLVAE